MSGSQEQVTAYVDGELNAAAAAAFEARLAGDAALRQAVQRERHLRATLAAAYDPVLNEPVPPALQALLVAAAPPAPVIDLAAARQRREAAQAPPSPARGWRWPAWGAMAACLVLGVAGGLALNPGRDAVPAGAPPGLAQAADGSLLAQGELAQGLSQALAGEPGAAGAMKVGLSFVARDGRYCRSFMLPGSAGLAGLACRGDAGWVVQGLVATAAPATGTPDYRQAASPLPPALLPLVEGLRAAEPLDAAAERAARDRGWRP